MGRPRGSATRILSTEDRGGRGAKRHRVRYLLNGAESSRGFATAGQAKAFVAKFEFEAARVSGKTVEVIIADWKAERESLRLYCPAYYTRQVTACLVDVLDQPVSAATAQAAHDGWTEYAKGHAGATALQARACLKIFAKWLVKKRLTLANIADGIEPPGDVKKGKPQIETVRELYAFRDEAWRRADLGDRASLGVLIGLYLGLRSGEVKSLWPRHIDLGRTVVVPGTKTAAAKRIVPVMVERLWVLLDAAAETGGPIVPASYSTLIRRVQECARAVGVANADDLCFHSLRGMAASLATKNGAAFAAIAEGLGHTSYEGMTAQHYATPESQQAAGAGRTLAVLQGGRR